MIQEIQAAAQRLADYLTPTPVLESSALNALVGQRVLLKAECLNLTGSFKIRGALNRMLRIDEAERSAGVVAMSSGNHAQAVAQAAAWLGIQATIVMPHDAPQLKRHNTERLGANVIGYHRTREDRELIAKDIRDRTGATLIHPFDDPQIMAGQGTCGLELAQYAQQQHIDVGALVAPCSGGGLIAGAGSALRHFFPAAKVIAAEPEHYNDHQLSLANGARVTLSEQPLSLCDALLTTTPGQLTFAVNQHQLNQVVTVSDTQVLAAMRYAALTLKLVIEPGGAAALAALLNYALPSVGDNQAIAIVLSGGNVDPQTLRQALAPQAA